MLLGSSILELALGMIFFYFLLSILCSHVNELIAGLLNRRGKDLVKGVQDLLNYPPAKGDTSALPEDLPEDASEAMRLIKTHFDQNQLGDLLLHHPLIQGLATQPIWLGARRRPAERQKANPAQQRPAWQRQRVPDYIPDRTFSLALIGMLLDVSDYLQKHGAARRTDQPRQAAGPTTNPDSAVPAAASVTALSDGNALNSIRDTIRQLPDGPRRTLLPFVESSTDSIEKLRASIENWYNAKMDRVSGVYKRRTQLWLLFIGMLMTVAINADSLAVITALWQYPTLRQAIAEQARQTANTAPSAPASGEISSDLTQIQQDVQNLLAFPITWGNECAYNRWLGVTIRADNQAPPIPQPGRVAPFDQPNCRPQSAPLDLSGWVLKLIGFVITAIAISLGASFWFDLLRKVSNLRSSGPAPGEPAAAATAQKPRDV